MSSLTSPYQIAGAIPFQNSGGFGGALGGSVGQAYTSSYNDALAQNAAQYQNILGGYQQLAGGQQMNLGAIAAGYNGLQSGVVNNLGTTLNNAGQTLVAGEGQIQQGYGQLSQNVQQTIQGITASQQQAINDAFKEEQGQTTSQLINSGLDNNTVLGAEQAGDTLQAQKASVALANQQAQLSAGYQSQLGLAQLGYGAQALTQNLNQSNLAAQSVAGASTQLGLAGLGFANQANQQSIGLGQNQLGFMNSVQMQYPNAQSYQQLLANQGALSLAQQNQAYNQQLANRSTAGRSNQFAPPVSYGNSGLSTLGNTQAIQGGGGIGGGGGVGGYGMYSPGGSPNLQGSVPFGQQGTPTSLPGSLYDMYSGLGGPGTQYTGGTDDNSYVNPLSIGGSDGGTMTA